MGTSCSAPAFAGIVSLLNNARLKAGKPPMGHLNPFLYQHPDAFTDITNGTNDVIWLGCSSPFLPANYSSKYCKKAVGFKCAKGWDPVTGLGTPLFNKLLSYALLDEQLRPSMFGAAP